MSTNRLPRHVWLCSGVLLLALAGCANTSRVLLAEPRPPLPVEQVRVYQTPPARYIEIARIETSSGVGFGTAGQTESAMLKLRREAAKVGANGVLLQAIETVASPVGIGIGGGRYGSRGGVSGGVGIPTAQRRAAGIAILVQED